jgi:hypothetical protein
VHLFAKMCGLTAERWHCGDACLIYFIIILQETRNRRSAVVLAVRAVARSDFDLYWKLGRVIADFSFEDVSTDQALLRRF